MFEAAALGRAERLRGLLDAEPELAAAWSSDGFTALHLAAFFGTPDAARALIDAGADVNAVARNSMRVQPLHSAAAARRTKTARLLVERGADVNARQEGGFAPIHAAAQNGDADLVDLLVAAGADAEARTDDGKSAADFAAG
ncbi:MAG: ankyrin repeat domain-containing protein [Actinomycetota bacterium]|nr:ankyrin repeat domain-containing protein [Actinomycetota bacterium]